MTFGLLWAVIGLLGITAQSAVSFFRKPNWVSQDTALDNEWRRLAIYSGLAGLATTIIVFILAITQNFNSFILAVIGPTTFVAFQSFFTDLRLRYVDRWIMRIANFIALGLGIYIMLTYGSESETVVFAIFAVIATAIIFMPGIGDADGRALQLLVFTLFPLTGLLGLKQAFMGILISIIVYYIIHSIIEKNWKLKGLLTKMSFPMVPLIVAPVVIVLIAHNWLPVF